ncbi:MAG: hypothetical protein P0S96_04155 [Simkaniaceae bacterium]|nr:hypothetical protein [Candidatus Sacchlamyda saccharinae]
MKTVGSQLNTAWEYVNTHVLSKSPNEWADVVKSVEPRSGLLIGTSILAGLVFARRAYKTTFCLSTQSRYRYSSGMNTGETRTYNFKLANRKIGYIVASALSFASAGHEASQQVVSKSLEAAIQTLTESLQEFSSFSNEGLGVIGIALFTGMVFAKKAWSSPLQVDLSFNSVSSGGTPTSQETIYTFQPIFSKLVYCALSAGAFALARHEISALQQGAGTSSGAGGWIN